MALFKSKKKKNKNVDVLDKNLENNLGETENNEEIDDLEKVEESDGEKINNDEIEDIDISNKVEEVIDYFTGVDPISLNMLERGKLSKDTFMDKVRDYVSGLVKDENTQNEIIRQFSSFVFSYDILDELINDKDVSDIKLYNYDRVRIKRLGKRENCDLKFRSEKHYRRFIEHVAIKNKVSISDQNAAQNFVDKDSCENAILRFDIVTGFLTSSGVPTLHIRKTPKTKPTRQELIDLGFFTDEIADYLEKRVEEGEGFLISGKGASGKTTCLNYLIDRIPEKYSGLIIQENEELHTIHPDISSQHTVTNRGEGKIEYTLQDLARNGLLMDIDYFIIGEIKGAEALYLLNAVYTGARGWASIHGASSEEAMKKLVDYIKYNSDYSQKEALQMLTHLDTVVFMENFKVKEIAEVVKYSEETGDLVYKRIL